jgi:hypothetical protein
MSTIPTESRIFADRYCREARRLEALHAGRISPGTRTRREAMTALLARMGKISPVKQEAMVDKAIAYLAGVKPEDCTHMTIASPAPPGRPRCASPPETPAGIHWWASRRRASASGST